MRSQIVAIVAIAANVFDRRNFQAMDFHGFPFRRVQCLRHQLCHLIAAITLAAAQSRCRYSSRYIFILTQSAAY